MKYIKTYEVRNPFKKINFDELIHPDISYKQTSPTMGYPYLKEKVIYWKIYPEGLEIALKRIGMDYFLIKNFNHNFYSVFLNNSYIFICKQILNDKIYWYYLPGNHEFQKELNRRISKYMGEIIIEPYEIDADKYNL